MSLIETEVATAEEQSREARRRLAATLVEIQGKLNPRTLAREAAQELKETSNELARAGVEALKEHSSSIAGGAAAVALLLGRKRLAGWFDHLVHKDETAAEPESLTDKPAATSRRRKEPKA